MKLIEQTLATLREEGILQNLILVGSWCVAAYREHYGKRTNLPAIRTLDIDLLIAKPVRGSEGCDVPSLLSKLGFDVQTSYPDGSEKFVHPELELEFLVAAKGKGVEAVQFVKQWGIKAQSLRYMSILQQNSFEISFCGIPIRVPNPAALAIHKLIISGYRRQQNKRIKDQQTAVTLLSFCSDSKDEWELVLELYASMPQGWRKRVKQVLRDLDPDLLQKIMDDLDQKS